MVIPCPKCKADLYENSELTLVDWVYPSHDPEGKARADLILECAECGAQFNAFVPLDEFQEIEAGTT